MGGITAGSQGALGGVRSRPSRRQVVGGVESTSGTKGIRGVTFHLVLKMGEPMRGREIATVVECKPRTTQSLKGIGLISWCQWALAGLVLLTLLVPVTRAQTA